MGCPFKCAAIALFLFSSSAVAAPPPPPQNYVSEAVSALVTVDDTRSLDRLFAPDVRVFRQGQLVADSKGKWMELLAAQREGKRNVLAYSQGNDLKSGRALIVDAYDPSNAALPPHSFGDPRYVSRATLYMFGEDHLIHTVQIIEAPGFWTQNSPAR